MLKLNFQLKQILKYQRLFFLQYPRTLFDLKSFVEVLDQLHLVTYHRQSAANQILFLRD